MKCSKVFVAVFLCLANVVVGELDTLADPDTLFLLTFEQAKLTYKVGDKVKARGKNAVAGTYGHELNSPSTVSKDDVSTNPFCFIGLPMENGAEVVFKPKESEWGQTGNFTLEIWATARIGTGYTYYESLVFGFPKHDENPSVGLYTRFGSKTTVVSPFTVSVDDTLEYSAVSYNGTHYVIYQNGAVKHEELFDKLLVDEVPEREVKIGGSTSMGFDSVYYGGTIYMVKYSGVARSREYIAANYDAYVRESVPEMTFTGKTHDQCAKLCMNGNYGFGGRKRCRSFRYTQATMTCVLQTFACDWSGVVPSAV